MKRVFDIVSSILALLVLSPVLLVLSFLIYIYIGRPVIFQQLRTGLNGQLFKIYKFRTMTNATDKNQELLSDSERMTRFGGFLRSTSLDELPELWNVLRGDMSLVGPRPLLVEYLDLYTIEQARRHDVKPGLTGWAQVNGRNSLTWEEKFHYDIWYVENNSMLLDIKIIFLTVRQLFKQDDISSNGHVSMPKFKGTNTSLLSTKHEE